MPALVETSRPIEAVPPGAAALPRYVLITPAKNEAKTISATIASVTQQTILPCEWVIVSDGSTDDTEAIVLAAAARFPWIRLLALPPRPQRSFAAVVRATELGIAHLTVQDFDFIGLLDSDVQFQPDYFERLIEQFLASPRLGLAGGVVIDVGTSRDRIPLNRRDVPGAVQFFRRSCFEALDGLVAIPEGGWDALTCASARRCGFETRLVPSLVVDHLKPRNSAEGGWLRRKWQLGVRDYALGYHPLYELIKCLGRCRDFPYVIGGIAWWIGFCSAMLSRRPRHIPTELAAFVRREQRARLFRLFRRPSRHAA